MSGHHSRISNPKDEENLSSSLLFEGECPELRGKVYDYKGSTHQQELQEQADQYLRTTEDITFYMRNAYRDGINICRAINHLHNESCTALTPPRKPPDDASDFDQLVWRYQIEQHAKDVVLFKRNVKRLYLLVWGQCTESLRNQIMLSKEFQKVTDEQDGDSNCQGHNLLFS